MLKRDIGQIDNKIVASVDTSPASTVSADIASAISDDIVASADAESNDDVSESVGGMRRCKNCGNLCDTAYCGTCGQSMSVQRLKPRQFFVDMLSGLLRINRGFIFTAKHLLLHPWRVIRDYIHGRRIAYTPPVNLLVILSFIGTIVIGLLIPEKSGEMASFEMPTNTSLLYRIGVSLGDFFANSAIAQNLTIYLPALLAIPLVYRRHGSNRYNIAEYLVAMIYMACSFMIFRIITSPLYAIFPDLDRSVINITYTICITGASLYMAFPLPTKKARIRHFIYYLLTAISLYTVLAFSLGVGIALLMD